PVGLRMGQQAAAVLDEFDVRGQIDGGEDAVAVDRRAALDDATGHGECVLLAIAHDTRSLPRSAPGTQRIAIPECEGPDRCPALRYRRDAVHECTASCRYWQTSTLKFAITMPFGAVAVVFASLA